MKLVIVALSLFVSSFSFAAAQGVKEFRVRQGVFAADHVQVPGKASFSVDYDKSIVTMFVERKMPPCPAGKMCAAVMPEPLIVQLPIQKVNPLQCGIRQVVAAQDNRPVDGDFKQITLEDATDITCRFLIARRSKASYQTSIFDRLTGKEVTNTSTMDIFPVDEDTKDFETLVMSEGTFLQGFPEIEKPATGTLTITDKEVQMDISINFDCGSSYCPRYIPQPMMVHLPIVERRQSGCGDVIVARADERDQDGSLREIQIVDYRNAVCRLATGFLVKVNYSQTYEGQNGPVVSRARFLFKRN